MYFKSRIPMRSMRGARDENQWVFSRARVGGILTRAREKMTKNVKICSCYAVARVRE